MLIYKGENKQHQIIVDHLNSIAASDTQLKKAFKDETKNVEDMSKYITDLAREELKNKNGYISSGTVFGWAIHYWTESNDNLKIVQTKPRVDNVEVTEVKPKKSKKEIKPLYEQLNLFSLGE